MSSPSRIGIDIAALLPRRPYFVNEGATGVHMSTKLIVVIRHAWTDVKALTPQAQFYQHSTEIKLPNRRSRIPMQGQD